MKALAAEMVRNFGKRLEPLGISVRELTGDMQLTKTEIMNTQVRPALGQLRKWQNASTSRNTCSYLKVVSENYSEVIINVLLYFPIQNNDLLKKVEWLNISRIVFSVYEGLVVSLSVYIRYSEGKNT